MLSAQPQKDGSHSRESCDGDRCFRRIAFLLGLLVIVFTGCAEESQNVIDDKIPAAPPPELRISHVKPVSVAGSAGHVSVSASLPEQALDMDKELDVLISFEIEPGFHLYRSFDPLGPFTPISVRVVVDEPAVNIEQTTIPETNEMVDGKPVFRDTLTVRTGVSFTNPKPGTITLKILVQYQACNDLVCMSPEDLVVEFPIVIKSSPPPSKR